MNLLPEALLDDPRIWRGRQHTIPTAPTLPSGYPCLDQHLVGRGWPVGALVECRMANPGLGELRLFMPALRHQSRQGKPLFFVNPPALPYGPALAQWGLPLNQIQTVTSDPSRDWLWTLEQILLCPDLGLVLAWHDRPRPQDLRRLQLAAESRSNTAVIFCPPEQTTATTSRLKLSLAPDPEGIRVRILKQRGGQPDQPLTIPMSWQPSVTEAG